MDAPIAVLSGLETARNTDYYEVFNAAFYTGLRRGELLALRWDDIDLDMATTSVSRTVYRAKGGESVLTGPKTTKGKRFVSLTPSSALMLREMRERQEVDGVLQGYQMTEDSPVFRYSDGSLILPRASSDAFSRTMYQGRTRRLSVACCPPSPRYVDASAECPPQDSERTLGPRPYRYHP